MKLKDVYFFKWKMRFVYILSGTMALRRAPDYHLRLLCHFVIRLTHGLISPEATCIIFKSCETVGNLDK